MDELDVHNRSRNRKQERRPPPPLNEGQGQQRDRQGQQQQQHQDRQPHQKKKKPSPPPSKSYDGILYCHRDDGDLNLDDDDPDAVAARHHRRLSESLRDLCSSQLRLVESPDGMRRRRRVMRDLGAMLSAWSESLLVPPSPADGDPRRALVDGDRDDDDDEYGNAAAATRTSMIGAASTEPTTQKAAAAAAAESSRPRAAASASGHPPPPPALLSFGSYRLGVHDPDADVDCLVLAPPHCKREDFFGGWVGALGRMAVDGGRISGLHPVARRVLHYVPVAMTRSPQTHFRNIS